MEENIESGVAWELYRAVSRSLVLLLLWLPKSTKIASWRRLEGVLEHLGGVLERLGSILGRLGASPSRTGASWKRLGASWRRLGAPWGRVGPSWRRLGGAWEGTTCSDRPLTLRGYPGREVFCGQLDGPPGFSCPLLASKVLYSTPQYLKVLQTLLKYSKVMWKYSTCKASKSSPVLQN